jgi:porphyrinogen peroxidase
MNAPQNGIFALGTASHAYLELDLVPGREGAELVEALASLREPRTTMGGINLVVGFRPELWAATSSDSPVGLEGFNAPVVGKDGYTMPATQHDAVLWLSGSAYDVVFESARGAGQSCRSSRSYRRAAHPGAPLGDWRRVVSGRGSPL